MVPTRAVSSPRSNAESCCEPLRHQMPRTGPCAVYVHGKVALQSLDGTSPQLLWPCWRVGTTLRSLPVSNVTCHHWVARLWQHSRPDSQRRLAASWRRCAAPPARLVTPLENNLACSMAFVVRHEIAAEFSLLCCCIAVVRGFGLRCSGCRR